jgi:hypothetical protein
LPKIYIFDTFVNAITSMTNVNNNIFNHNKMNYSSGKHQAHKSRKEKLSNWHSGKKKLSSMYRYIENYYVPNGY